MGFKFLIAWLCTPAPLLNMCYFLTTPATTNPQNGANVEVTVRKITYHDWLIVAPSHPWNQKAREALQRNSMLLSFCVEVSWSAFEDCLGMFEELLNYREHKSVVTRPARRWTPHSYMEIITFNHGCSYSWVIIAFCNFFAFEGPSICLELQTGEHCYVGEEKIVSVLLGREEGYTVKYGLSPRAIPRA